MPNRSFEQPRPSSREQKSTTPVEDHRDARRVISMDGRFPSEPLTIPDPKELPKELLGAYLMG